MRRLHVPDGQSFAKHYLISLRIELLLTESATMGGRRICWQALKTSRCLEDPCVVRTNGKMDGQGGWLVTRDMEIMFQTYIENVQ